MLAALILPLVALSADPGLVDLPDQTPPSLEQDRLSVCLKQARTDPSTAITTASLWNSEATDAERSFPQQCLGVAYTSLLRWQAAESAFLTARDDMLVQNTLERAKLASMAGNAALADGRNEDALTDLALASADAAQGGSSILAGEVEIDRSRALVGLGRLDEAASALEKARTNAPQNSDSWLLSATLARRKGDLSTAAAQIVTAAGLDPANPAIALEAGVIAVLSGNEDAARKSWQAVLTAAPDGPEAETARGYLAQIGQPAAAPEPKAGKQEAGKE